MLKTALTPKLTVEATCRNLANEHSLDYVWHWAPTVQDTLNNLAEVFSNLRSALRSHEMSNTLDSAPMLELFIKHFVEEPFRDALRESLVADKRAHPHLPFTLDGTGLENCDPPPPVRGHHSPQGRPQA